MMTRSHRLLSCALLYHTDPLMAERKIARRKQHPYYMLRRTSSTPQFEKMPSPSLPPVPVGGIQVGISLLDVCKPPSIPD